IVKLLIYNNSSIKCIKLILL
ncbi:uncharacterized protein Dsimw501_GD29229, partial [Drosophila simulans]